MSAWRLWLEDYKTVTAGTYELAPGESRDVDHATFTCPAGGAACRITVEGGGGG